MGIKGLWVAAGRFPVSCWDTVRAVSLETMLGTEFDGVLSSDDFSVYNGYRVRHNKMFGASATTF